jgi:hypothetical protein
LPRSSNTFPSACRAPCDETIIGWQRSPRRIQCLRRQAFCVIEFCLIDPQQTESHQTVERVAILRPAQTTPLVERGLQQGVGAVVVAETLIQAAERLIERRLDRWLAVETTRFLHAPIDKRDHAQIVRRRRVGLACVEQVQHELLDARRPRRFLARRGVGAVETHGIERRHDAAAASIAAVAARRRAFRRTNFPVR